VDADIEWTDEGDTYDVLRRPLNASGRTELATNVTPPYSDADAPGGQEYAIEVNGQRTEYRRPIRPDHRWQMPLPRNLLSDPESFDPGDTVWEESKDVTYIGVAKNVGPNGEDAAELEWTGDFGSFRPSITSLDVTGDITGGFYVRAKTGIAHLFTDLDNVADGADVGTEWTWLTASEDDVSNFSIFELRCLNNRTKPYRIYLLRAGLNLGDSLEYSTRSQVPQTIPDVIQGADLQNGSQSGADTNDLDFGVGESGVPYAVGGGDDQTSTLPQDGTETWATRVYIPSSVGADVELLGRMDYAYPTLAYDDTNGDLRLRYKDSGSNTQQGPRVSALEGQWHAVAITIDGSDLRLNVGGTTDEQTGTDLSITADPRLLGTQSGARVQHPEQHPVLTEAEAEAVRQRLAGNPPDPVAPTEAWDFTAETNPHNLVTQSEDITGSDWNNKRLSVTPDVTTDPAGGSTADELVNNDQQFPLVRNRVKAAANRTVALVAYLKANASNVAAIRIDASDGNSNFEQYLQPFDLAAGSIGTAFYDTDQGYIVSGSENPKMQEVGNAWYRCYLSVEYQNGGFMKFHGIELLDSSGDRISDTQASNNTYSVYVWGNQVIYGDNPMPPYVKTDSSIAFSQTVPALRDSSNDLALGSKPNKADTNDGSWIAPIGMAEDGDDQLRAPTKRPTVTWVERVKYTATRATGRSSNGWKVTATDLVVEDTNGNTASAAHGKTINDGTYHTLAVTIDEVGGVAEVYIDGATSPDATVDLSTVGTLKSNDVELLAEGGTIKQPAYYTRTLSGEEIAYLHERLVDNPTEPFPNYTTP
jgi:hypothetical protein